MNLRLHPVTVSLIAISVLVYLLQTFGDQQAILRALLISAYYEPLLPEIKSGDLWRIFTPMFLHFSIFHIAFNMLWTWELGRIIENRQNKWMLLLVVLVSSGLSNLGQYWFSGPLFGGMSGVVYGLFGYVWIQGLTNARFGLILNPPIVYLMLGWFVICWTGILEKIFGLGVANSAHTIGLLSGIVISLLFTAFYGRWRSRR